MLVAGIGNIFLGDDAFGSEVARRLASGALPQGVGVRDFGIRAIDLAYALMTETRDAVLAAMRANPAGRDAAIIGEIADDPAEVVTLVTPFGGERVVDMLVGEQLPRIC